MAGSYFLTSLYAEAISSFKYDCEQLIKAFEEKESELYKDNFATVWKAFGFNLIYDKYSKKHDVDDQIFKEDSLQVAKFIMLNGKFVGGMYLLYSLYYMQGEPKTKTRIDLSEYKQLKKLLQEERQSLIGTCLPGFMFTKLLRNDAFSYTAFSREYTVEGQQRALMILGADQTSSMDFKIASLGEWFDDFLDRTQNIEYVNKIEEYLLMKKIKIESERPELNLSLDKEPQDFIAGLDTESYDCEMKPILPEEGIGDKRKKLKARVVKIRRRYAKPDEDSFTIKQESCIKDEETEKRKKSYVRKRCLVRSNRHIRPETSSSEDEEDNLDKLSDSSTSDEPKLSLPDIH